MTSTLHSQARPLGLSVWRSVPCLRSGAPLLRSRLSLALPKPACKYEQSTGRAHACFAARRDNLPAEADSGRADVEAQVEIVSAERDPRSDFHPAQKLFTSLLKGFAVAALVVGLVRTLLLTYSLDISTSLLFYRPYATPRQVVPAPVCSAFTCTTAQAVTLHCWCCGEACYSSTNFTGLKCLLLRCEQGLLASSAFDHFSKQTQPRC